MENHWLNFAFFTIDDYQLTIGALIFSVILFIAALVLSKLAQRAITRITKLRPAITPAQVYTINRFVHYLVLVVGVIFSLSALGLDLTKLAFVGGALGIGIGLGLQGIVNNFLSGLIILIDKSLKVGDFIELSNDLVGEVIQINIRSTTIRTNDNVDIIVPNSEFIAARVTNWTLDDDIRRFLVPFSVAYGTDKDAVRNAAIEAAFKVAATLKDDTKKPAVWMTSFGDSSLNFVLAVWVNAEAVKRPSSMRSEYLWEIDNAFRKHAIEIPFPQRDLHLRSGFPPTSENKI